MGEIAKWQRRSGPVLDSNEQDDRESGAVTIRTVIGAPIEKPMIEWVYKKTQPVLASQGRIFQESLDLRSFNLSVYYPC